MTDAIEELFKPARTLANDDTVWNRHHFVWKSPAGWMPQLTAWLAPRFRTDGMRRLKPGIERDICWDDSDWSRILEKCLTADLAYHTDKLAEAIERAVLRTYHGCRTSDVAAKMLREWVRLACNQPDWSAPIDFTFMLRANIPPQWIVGHSHPATFKDSLDSHNTYRSPSPHCEYCKPY